MGLYHLEDPATGESVASYREAIPAARLIKYTDLPPMEQPLNPNEEVWIEIKSNDVARSDTWLLRRIESQCDTGEVRIAAQDGSDSRIIDLTQYSYHFVKPPSSVGAPTLSGQAIHHLDSQCDPALLLLNTTTRAIERTTSTLTTEQRLPSPLHS